MYFHERVLRRAGIEVGRPGIRADVIACFGLNLLLIVCAEG